MKKVGLFSFGILISFLCILFFTPQPAKQIPQNMQWEIRNSGIDFGGVNCMIHHPDNNGIMIIGTKIKGLFISTSYTKKWKNILSEKFDKNWINCIAIDPHNKQKILIGTLNGLYISNNMGVTWYEKKVGASFLQVFSIAFHPIEKNVILIGTYEGGIIKSNDGGVNWSYLYKGNPNLNYRVTSIQYNPNNPNQVFASLYGKGILVSENGGNQWSEANTGLYDLSVLSMKIDPKNPSTLYAGSLGGLFQTINGGKNWVSSNNGLIDVWKEIYSITINPTNTNEIYIGSNNGYVYFSNNYGKNWEQLPQIKSKENSEIIWVYDLLLDPLHTNMLYAGTNAGVFRYRNSDSSVNSSLTLEIKKPQMNDIIKDQNVIVEGYAADTEFGLEKVLINQKQINVNEDGHFKHTEPLINGRNSLIINALNNDGVSTSKIIQLFGIIDKTKPIIALDYPDINGSLKVTTNTIVISGRVYDNESGIDNVYLKVVNITSESIIIPVNSKGYFEKTLVLNRGNNKITLSAVNCAGLYSDYIFDVFYEFSNF